MKSWWLVGTCAAALTSISYVPSVSGSEPAPRTLQVEEVVVTAQRRRENVQEIPAAISTFSAEEMERSKIHSVGDFAMLVPGLVFTNLGGNAQPYIRGIGSDLTGIAVDPSTASYVDGVYVPNNYAVDALNLLGVERVEVLKGPQGTLYGRNAVGGAINTITRTPGQETEASAVVTLGNYNRWEVSGFASTGVTPNLAVGVYAAYSKRNPYTRMVGPIPLGQPTHETNGGARIKAVFTPTSAIKLTGSVEWLKESSFDDSGFRQVQSNAVGYIQGAPRISGRHLIDAEAPNGPRVDVFQFTLREEIDFGWASLLGVTGHRNFDHFGSGDVDATRLPIFVSGPSNGVSNMWSQELQLLSPSSSKVKWNAGLFLYKERTGQNPVYASGSALGAAVGSRAIRSFVDIKSIAGFGQITVPIGDRLNVTAGGRYTRDRAKWSANLTFTDKAGFVNFGPYTINSGNVISSTNYGPSSTTWSKFTPKASIDYKVAEDFMIYATYSKGFKAGIYSVTAPTAPGPIRPEDLSAYEIGFKSELFDNRVRFNAAGYHYSIKDLQGQIITASVLGTILLQNAASAKTNGFDADMSIVVGDGLSLYLSSAYLDAYYQSFPRAVGYVPAVAGNATRLVNATGNSVPRSPKWTFTVAPTYVRDLSDGMQLHANITWHHVSSFYFDSANRARQPGYGVMNATLGVTLANGVDVTAWATNLTNSYYLTAVNVNAYGTFIQEGSPGMYGVTLAWKY